MMKTSDKGLVMLMGHEAIVPMPYYDSAKPPVLTYGVGHTAAAGPPNPASLDRKPPVDLETALRNVFEVFRRDIAKYEQDVNEAFTRPLTQEQFDAAVSFHFNTGAIKRASWVKSFNRGQVSTAVEQIMNWTKPSSIIERRKDEQHLFATGKYPNKPIPVYFATETGKVIWKPQLILAPETALEYMKPAAPKSSGLLETIMQLFAALFGGKK